MNRLLLFIFFFSVLIFSNAQNPTLDSFKLALKNAKHDTTRCAILNAMIEEESDDAIWPKYNEQLKDLAELNAGKGGSLRKGYLKYVAVSLNNIGYIYKNRGDIQKALEFDHKSLKVFYEIGEKKGIASSLNNIGTIYAAQGNIAKALEYYGKSLKIREEIDDKNGVATSLINIGVIYENQGDISKALGSYFKSLKILKELGNKKVIAFSLNSIGLIYNKQDNFAKALEYFDKSLKIREEIGDKSGIAFSLNNIGLVYHKQDNITKALEYFCKSLKLLEETGDKDGMARSTCNIGCQYLKQKNTSKALVYALKSMALSKELGFPEKIKYSADLLNKIYRAMGNHKLALENYELFIQMRDSINNIETQKASIKQQSKYAYEKQKAIDEQAHQSEIMQQQEKAAAEKNKQNIIIASVSLVLLLVLTFSVILFNRFRITQHQNEVIAKQKHLIEEKHKEVTDSIRYAKRIQSSLLPSDKYIDKAMKRPGL